MARNQFFSVGRKGKGRRVTYRVEESIDWQDLRKETSSGIKF